MIYKFDNTESNYNLMPVLGDDGQFAYQRGLRIGPLDISKTGISIDNGTVANAILLNAGGFYTYNNVGANLMTLDSATGLNITDGVNNVFKAIIQGTDIGDVDIGNYPSAGAYYNKSANGGLGSFTISGTLAAGSLQIGTSPNWFCVDASGNIWSGADTFVLASATFRVSNAGALTANSAYIQGNIQTGAGSVISADYITAGTLIGRTVQSSSGNDRIVLDNGDYLRFYVGGTLRASLRGASATRATGIIQDGDYVTANNKSYLIKSSAGGASEYAGIGVTSGNQFWLTLGTDNSFYMKNNAQNDNYFTVSNDRAYHKSEFQANKFTSNSGNLTLDAEGTNKVFLASNIDMNEKNIDACDTIYAYHFTTRSEVYEGNPFEVLNTIEPEKKSGKGWNKLNHDKLHKDILMTNDKGEKGYALDRLIEIQRLAILQMQERIVELERKIQ
jgi:hypothetical protein